MIAGASFCSTTRSYGPPIGQCSKSAHTRRTPSTSWCAQCDVSHWGDTSGEEARRQEQTAKKPSRDFLSLFPARTPRQQGAPAVCRTRLLRSCWVSQHAAAHHCTSHTIAQRTPLYTAHHCTPYRGNPYVMSCASEEVYRKALKDVAKCCCLRVIGGGMWHFSC